MSISKLWRLALFAIWFLYALGVVLAVRAYLGDGDPDARALAAYDMFSAGFMVPVGILTVLLLLLQRRADPAQQRAFKTDERRIAVSTRAITAGFWVFLFGIVFALTVFREEGLSLSAVVLTLILGFGVFFAVATKDEIDTARLEAAADD